MPDEVKTDAVDTQDTTVTQTDTTPAANDIEGRLKSLENELRHEKSLRSKAEKQVSEYQKAQQDANDKKLADDGKWKDLADQREGRIKELEAQATESAIHSAVLAAAAKAGIADPEDAYQLANLSGIKMGDDGKVAGADDVVAALVKAKPYLVKTTNGAPFTGATNPATGPTLQAADIRKMSAAEIAALSPEDYAALMTTLAKK